MTTEQFRAALLDQEHRALFMAGGFVFMSMAMGNPVSITRDASVPGEADAIAKVLAALAEATKLEESGDVEVAAYRGSLDGTPWCVKLPA